MFDFANTPTVGQQLTEPNGAVVQWDGVKWVSVAGQPSSVTPTYNNVGRNLLHNSMFNVQQRGAGPFSTSGAYTLDRWQLAYITDTGVSVSPTTLSDAARTAIGDEAAVNCLQLTTTGNAAAGAFTEVLQAIETARRLSGKTVTVSFWAVGSVGTLKLGVNGATNFGTGGSPSAQVSWQTTGQAITLSTAWARYSATFTIPSTAGKTFGSNGNDCNYLQIWLSSGANNNAQAGNIGVQSGTVQIWGVQLEIGSTATPLEKIDPGEDLRRCQRFFCTGAFYNMGYAPVSGATIGQWVGFPITMRAVPTVTPTYTTQTNCGSSSVTVLSAGSVVVSTVNSGTAVNWTLQGTFTASADL